MEMTALCMVVASLRVVPNRSQFFPYESVSLSCEEQGSSSGWRVMRNTTTTMDSPDGLTEFGIGNESHRFFDDLYPLDSGVYWCESGSGRCSDAINITVTDGSVILESPGLPVMEGSDVTLRCRNKRTPSNLTADFYKDGVLIRSSSTGEMTIHSVSKSDEGFYKCSISDSEESKESWLAVRALVDPDAGPTPAAVMSVLRVMLHVVVGTPYLLSTIILGLIYRDRNRAQREEQGGRHVVDMAVE
ncbi:sialoadhesin-like isoform X2 [Myripristis murdjan]|uniref:sialoadhesin-like isoform X2 n=1 Tax=Myripristis murdjan TaxID=586833 RepID=UPI001175D822|nr:sialoadhesin-like isoform X2 [Myripristis murdjan]